MIKKIIIVLMVMCFCTLLTLPSTVSAASFAGEKGDTALPMYTDTSKISCNLSISGNVATINASVRGKASTVKKCSMKVELQEKVGVLWITKSSWNVDGVGNELSVSKSANVSEGQSYRVRVTSTVYTESGSEKASQTSGTQVAP